MKLRILILLFLCFPLSAMAVLDGFCTPTPSAIGGFNIDNYKQCKALLRQCPKHGPIVDDNCERKVTHANPVCIQLKRLSMKMYATPSTVHVQKAGKVLLATKMYPADGQEQFFILTPNACLIDTVIDPRKLDASVAKQYQGADLFIANWERPRFKINSDGSETATARLKVTKSCRACALVGWATVQFYFSPEGLLKDVQLESFKK